MEHGERGCSAGPTPEVFAAAAEQFARLLQMTAGVSPGAKGFAQALEQVRASLVAQLQGWLQSAHPFATPWFPTPASSTSLPGAGPGMASLFVPDLPRIQSALSDWGRLQAQLAVHWSTIASVACEKFLGQMADPGASASLRDARKLYERWIDCAEEAYAQTAHSEAFCNVVAELINTGAALHLLGQERAQAFAGAVSLPTRSELDALQREVAELKRQMARPSRPIRRGKPPRQRKRQR
jgi:poly[(R)-3-hydroxyalkanoate] polymerase subunit PhaE